MTIYSSAVHSIFQPKVAFLTSRQSACSFSTMAAPFQLAANCPICRVQTQIVMPVYVHTEDPCPICQSAMGDSISTFVPCGHVCCRECMGVWVAAVTRPLLPQAVEVEPPVAEVAQEEPVTDEGAVVEDAAPPAVHRCPRPRFMFYDPVLDSATWPIPPNGRCGWCHEPAQYWARRSCRRGQWHLVCC